MLSSGFSVRRIVATGAVTVGVAVFSALAYRYFKRGFVKTNKIMSNHNEDIVKRAQGCLLGQYVGDALGTRYEFRSEVETKNQVSKDRNGKGFLSILGGGPFKLKAGQVTDDTELAMALARSLLTQTTYDRAAVASAYKYWYDSGPFDVGTTTRKALSLPHSTQPEDVLESMLDQAREGNKDSLSNGCLMRISPLAIAGATWPDDVISRCAQDDAQLTNPHPTAQVAVACYFAATSELIRSGDVDVALAKAKHLASDSPEVSQLLAAATDNKVEVLLSNGKVAEYDGKEMGYLGIAFQWAFAELLHAKSFEEGLIRVISRGGDTDTNGCICGAMLGARFGEDAIPEQWKDTVINSKQRRLNNYPWVDSSDLMDVAIKLLDVVPPKLEEVSKL